MSARVAGRITPRPYPRVDAGRDCAREWPRMRVAEGFVIAEQDVPGVRAPGDTAEVRTTIDASHGCERLEQHVMRFSPGRSLERAAGGQAGGAVRRLGNGDARARRRRGTSSSRGRQRSSLRASRYASSPTRRCSSSSVTAPASELGVGEPRRVTVRHEDQPSLPASPNREFRYLVNQDAGCLDVTQFVGVIPPGKAPEHSHTYDEVVYILEGTGTLPHRRRRGSARTGNLPPSTAVHEALPREQREDGHEGPRGLSPVGRSGIEGE